MRLLLTISQAAAPRIALSPQKRSQAAIESNIAEAVSHIQGGSREIPEFAIFCITSNEYQSVTQTVRLKNGVLVYAIIVLADDASPVAPEITHDQSVVQYRTSPFLEGEFDFLIDRTFFNLKETFRLKKEAAEHYLELYDMKQDQADLINMGRSLSIEKDPEKLLRLILFLSKKITRCGCRQYLSDRR